MILPNDLTYEREPAPTEAQKVLRAQLAVPCAEPPVCAALADLFAEIDALPDWVNWGGNNEEPVQPETRARAKALLREAHAAAADASLAWQEPGVCPNPDGGIELSWEGGEHWAMLTVPPQGLAWRSVTEAPGRGPQYEAGITAQDAERTVLWVLRAPG